MKNWLVFVTSLPTENASARMRVWRMLKTSGAAVLRDGVYLLPDRPACHTLLSAMVAEVAGHGGSAWLLRAEEPEGAGFVALFDRSADYAALLDELQALRTALAADTAADTHKTLRKLRKSFQAWVAIDFFPGQAQRQAEHGLVLLEQACARALSPGEPQPLEAPLEALNPQDYQRRIWATRQRPWVDRLASAWLIRRFIDPEARLVWSADPQSLPAEVLGFDFEGARFSHTPDWVTFEVLLASFGLRQTALLRLGQLVHSLDVGGVRPAEASGVEGVLAGLRTALPDDDQLFAAACAVFDGLLNHFSSPTAP